MRLAVSFQRVDPSRGGAETYVADLCRRLAVAGHDVTLFANEWRAGALPASVRCVKVEATGRTRWGRIWSFAKNSEKALREASPDCTIGLINTWHQDILIPQGGVHAASLEANSKRFASRIGRALYVASKAIQPKSWLLYRAIERRQYDRARGARIVAVSRMVRGHLERFHGVTPDRVRVIPNAIDASRLKTSDGKAARAKVRARHGLDATEVVGLFVGHNFRLKGLPALLRAMALRVKSNPNAGPIRLLVCGGGRVGPMQKLVDRLGLSDSVRIVGFADDIRDYYHAADFCVLPSYYDPCSLVVFEALACGLPVITTKQNGAGEVIREGVEGFVVESPDAFAELARALDRMTDGPARMAMSRKATELGRAQSLDRHVGALLELAREVVESRIPTGSALRADEGGANRPTHEMKCGEVGLGRLADEIKEAANHASDRPGGR